MPVDGIDLTAPAGGVRPVRLSAEGRRFHVPERRHAIPLKVSFVDVRPRSGSGDRVRRCRRPPRGSFPTASTARRPLTLEAWFRVMHSADDRLITKTEVRVQVLRVGCEAVLLAAPTVPTSNWHRRISPCRPQHCTTSRVRRLRVRMYLDGRLVGRMPADGVRTNELPFVVGGDVDRSGEPFFDGAIDEVRLSAPPATTTGSSRRRHEHDDATVLLLHMDARRGAWIAGDAGRGINPAVWSDPVLVESGAGSHE